MTSEPFDRAISALSRKHRRQLLVALHENNPQTLEDAPAAGSQFGAMVAENEDPTHVEVAFIHSHLPRLEANGYINWDRENGEITKGTNWEEVLPLIDVLEERADTLPDGWV